MIECKKKILQYRITMYVISQNHLNQDFQTSKQNENMQDFMQKVGRLVKGSGDQNPRHSGIA